MSTSHDNPGDFQAPPVEWPAHPLIIFVALPMVFAGLLWSLDRFLDAFAAAWFPGAVETHDGCTTLFLIVAIVAAVVTLKLGGF